MRLILIRHGETQSNVNHQLDTSRPGMPLNERGLQQAQTLVAALADEPIEKIYASSLTRAQQTAAPLAAARGLDVGILDGLREISAGAEEMNTDWSNYIDVLSRWSPQNLDIGLPEGETARAFLTRYSEAISRVETGEHHCAAVVSHGAALRVWSLFQDPSIDPDAAVPLRNTEWIVLNGSTTTGWRIERWGQNVIATDEV